MSLVNALGESTARIGSSVLENAEFLIPVIGNSILRVTEDQELDLTELTPQSLIGVDQIELADGRQSLTLDVDSVAELSDGGLLTVIADLDDELEIGDGWEHHAVELDESNRLIRLIEQAGTVVGFHGPDSFHNPLDRFDVNRSESLTSADALIVINELGRRRFSAREGGDTLDPTQVDLTKFHYYDVSRDFRISSLDALQVINELGRRTLLSEGELIQGRPADRPTFGLGEARTETRETGRPLDEEPANLESIAYDTSSNDVTVAVADAMASAQTRTDDSGGVEEAAVDQLIADLAFDWISDWRSNDR